jgi:hypothetical protein
MGMRAARKARIHDLRGADWRMAYHRRQPSLNPILFI